MNEDQHSNPKQLSSFFSQ